jgi:hypothetical protein
VLRKQWSSRGWLIIAAIVVTAIVLIVLKDSIVSFSADEPRRGLDALLTKDQRTELDRYGALPGAPPIKALLVERLLLDPTSGVVVEELPLRDVGRNIGRAECNGSSPVIHYANPPDDRLSSYGLLYFREHELAHHRKNHRGCGLGPPSTKTPSDQELEADCLAALTLRGRPGGEMVLMAGVAHLLQIKDDAVSTRPSSGRRVLEIFSRHCLP